MDPNYSSPPQSKRSCNKILIEGEIQNRATGSLDIQAGKPRIQEQMCTWENLCQREKKPLYCREKPLPSKGRMMQKKKLQSPVNWCTDNKNRWWISPRNTEASDNLFTMLVSFPAFPNSFKHLRDRSICANTIYHHTVLDRTTSPSPRGNTNTA